MGIRSRQGTRASPVELDWEGQECLVGPERCDKAGRGCDPLQECFRRTLVAL